MGRRRQTISSVQLKSIFILLLLAGHEAHRISDQAKISQSALEGPSPRRTSFENKWAKTNEACKWSTTGKISSFGRTGCVGAGCSYRRLPLDLPPPSSQSCRLSDEFMLESDRRSDFVTMQAGLLKSKALKYRLGKCGGSLSPWCVRRLRHMMRSVEFIAKAQKDKDRGFANQSDAQQAEQRLLIDSALKGIAETHGENGELILQLHRKLTASSGSTMKADPKATTMRVVALLTGLLQGSPQEHAEAKQAITRLPDIGADSVPLPKDMEEAIEQGETDAVGQSNLMSLELAEQGWTADDVSEEAQREADKAVRDAFDSQLHKIESSLDRSADLAEEETLDSDTVRSMDVILAAALPLNSEDEQGESLVELDGSRNNVSGGDEKLDIAMLVHGPSHSKLASLVDELMKLGMSPKDAKRRATRVLQYERDQKGIRPLTTFMWILTIGVVVMASVFAVVEIVAMLTYWILFGLIGCSSYAALYNIGKKDYNDNRTLASKKWSGKMTGKDIMRCSAKAIWIFLYAPAVVALTVLKLTVELVVLPFKLIRKVLGLVGVGKKKRGGKPSQQKPRRRGRMNAKLDALHTVEEAPRKWKMASPGRWVRKQEGDIA